MPVHKISYGLTPFQRDLVEVINAHGSSYDKSEEECGVSLESGVELMKKLRFHPTLLVQHYIPHELLLTTPMEGVSGSSDCMNVFLKFFSSSLTAAHNRVDEISTNAGAETRVLSSRVCVVTPSSQHLDLIERVLLSLPGRRRVAVKRVSGLALLPEHTFSIPTDEELAMLRFLKREKAKKTRLEEEDKRRIGKNRKNKKRKPYGSGSSGSNNNSNTTLSFSVPSGSTNSAESGSTFGVELFDESRYAYVTKQKYVVCDEEGVDTDDNEFDTKTEARTASNASADEPLVFYLMTSTHLRRLGVRSCLLEKLRCHEVITFEEDITDVYPSDVDVHHFQFTPDSTVKEESTIPMTVQFSKDLLLKFLKEMETTISANTSAVADYQIRETVRQDQMEQYKQGIRELVVTKWHNKLDTEVQASEKKVRKIEDDTTRLLQYHDEITSFSATTNLNDTAKKEDGEEILMLEKEIKELHELINKENTLIEQKREMYQKTSNRAVSSTQELGEYEKVANYYKNNLSLLTTNLDPAHTVQLLQDSLSYRKRQKEHEWDQVQAYKTIHKSFKKDL